MHAKLYQVLCSLYILKNMFHAAETELKKQRKGHEDLPFFYSCNSASRRSFYILCFSVFFKIVSSIRICTISVKCIFINRFYSIPLFKSNRKCEKFFFFKKIDITEKYSFAVLSIMCTESTCTISVNKIKM